jgi:hypothetical protein
MTWESVFTVSDFFDGPRRGVANFGGKPHAYQSEFSDTNDEYSDRFLLMEIDPELFRLVMEDWAIWQRWLAAYRRGTASTDSHPALPEDRMRHHQIEQLIGSRLHVEPTNCFVKRAKFRQAAEVWEVQWYDVAI